MGPQPYYYFCDYQEDAGIALQQLRQYEFKKRSILSSNV